MGTNGTCERNDIGLREFDIFSEKRVSDNWDIIPLQGHPQNIFDVLEEVEDKEDVDTMLDEFKLAYNETAKVALGRRRKDVKESGWQKTH